MGPSARVPNGRGCRTCRLRKIRCDLGEPECQNCFTRGKFCPGYNTGVRFKIVSASSWPKRCDQRGHECRIDDDSPSAKQETTSSVPKDFEKQQCAGPLCAINQYAVDCELFGELFLGMFMPVDYGSRSAAMVPGGWVSLFPAVFHGKDNLLNKSLLALYTGFVGRRNGDEGLADLGMQLYADALYQLRTSDLWSPRKKQLDVDAKLASIIVFSRCELFTAQAGGGGYMAHVRGGLELLRRHATRLPRNELSKMIVKKLRILGLYATIRHREPFFMSKEPFSSLYVAEPGDPDYIPQRGFESMAKFPALAKRADELDTRKYTGTKAAMSGQRTAQSLLEAAKTLAENLRSWHSELTAAIPAPKHAFAASTTGHATHGFPTGYLHYAGPGHNYVWMLYWVFALYVNLLIKQLQIRHAQLASLLAEPRSLPSDLAELGISYDTLDEYAENISKSIFGTYHSSALEAQETMAPIFTLQWYYEQRGDAVKIHRCIETIRILEHEGLALDLRVQRAGSIPKARAGFLAELGKGMMPEAEAGILAENSELSLGSKKTQD